MMRLRRRTTVALTAGGLLTVSVISVAMFAVLRPATTAATTSPSDHRTITDRAPVHTDRLNPTVLAPLRHTDDPILYGTAVARALFIWDTTSGLTPSDYESVISEDADPSGQDTAGLVSDMAVYFPTQPQWEQLALYKTAQTLTIDRVYVPAAWTKAVAADPSAERPGMEAVTVVGVRHRTGEWFHTPTSLAITVSFTLMIDCSPTFPRCHVLRISGLDTPLK